MNKVLLPKMFYQVSSIIVFSFTMIANSGAQESAELGVQTMPSSPWITIGIGGATHRFAIAGDFSYPLNIHLFSAHVIYMSQMGLSDPESKDIEYSLLYGLHSEGEVAMVSISSGLSLIESHHVIVHEAHQVDSSYYLESYTMENAVSVGIPLEAQLFFNLGRHFGLGVIYFTNFSHFYSYSGVLVSYRIRF